MRDLEEHLDILDNMNNRHITKAKIKRSESAKLKGSTSIELYCSLTVTFSEMPASF